MMLKILQMDVGSMYMRLQITLCICGARCFARHLVQVDVSVQVAMELTLLGE